MKTRTLLCLLFGAAALAAAPIFSLDPLNGYLSGAPGDRPGLGFTLVNEENHLTLSQVVFVPSGAAIAFEDFASEDFRIVGPLEGTIWTESFDLASRAGLGAFTVPLAAQNGDTFPGEVRLYYDLFSVSPNDPSFDPGVHQVASGEFVSANVELTAVVASTAVPEPSTFGLLALAAGIAFARRRR